MHVWPRWVYWNEIRIKYTVLLQVLLPDDRCARLANKKQRHTNTTCNIPGPYKGLVIVIIYINGIWFHVMSCRMQKFDWNRFVTGVNIVICVMRLWLCNSCCQIRHMTVCVVSAYNVWQQIYFDNSTKNCIFQTCIVYRQAYEKFFNVYLWWYWIPYTYIHIYVYIWHNISY